MFCLCLSIYQQDRSKIITNFDDIFGRVGCVTSNSWLDFRADPNHDVETGIFFTVVVHRKYWIIVSYAS